MRVLRFMLENNPVYGVAREDSTQVAVIKGDPLFNAVEPAGPVADLNQIFPLCPVIPRSKVVCIPTRSAEGDAPAYLKPNTSVVGPDDPVVIPGDTVDAEISVGVILKTMSKNLSAGGAWDAIFGWVLVHNFGSGHDFAGRGFDTSSPLGPWALVNPRFDPEILDVDVTAPPSCQIQRRTPEISVEAALQAASKNATLLPGDIVVLPPLTRVEGLRPGDALLSQAGALGELRNPIMAAR